MSLTAALWFFLGWMIAGFVNGITGFGAAITAMPLVTLGMDLSMAVPACSLMTWIVSLEQGRRYRGHADVRRIMPVVIGALPGAFAGFLALRHLPPQHVQAALGVFLILYSVWGLFFEGAKMTVISRLWGYAAGFFSTAFGAAFSFNGPPLAVYASLSGWGKQASKAGLAMTFIVTAGLMVIAQIFAGTQNSATALAACIGTPAALAGAWLGFRVSRAISDKTYRRLFFAFIGCAGLYFLRQTFG